MKKSLNKVFFANCWLTSIILWYKGKAKPYSLRLDGHMMAKTNNGNILHFRQLKPCIGLFPFCFKGYLEVCKPEYIQHIIK